MKCNNKLLLKFLNIYILLYIDMCPTLTSNKLQVILHILKHWHFNRYILSDFTKAKIARKYLNLIKRHSCLTYFEKWRERAKYLNYYMHLKTLIYDL